MRFNLLKCGMFHFLEKRKCVKSFEETVEDVKKMYGCHVELLTDSDGNFLGMFLQDLRMKEEFKAFPEVIIKLKY